jgi:hypothetical protein
MPSHLSYCTGAFKNRRKKIISCSYIYTLSVFYISLMLIAYFLFETQHKKAWKLRATCEMRVSERVSEKTKRVKSFCETNGKILLYWMEFFSENRSLRVSWAPNLHRKGREKLDPCVIYIYRFFYIKKKLYVYMYFTYIHICIKWKIFFFF